MHENEPGGYPPEAFTLRATAELVFGAIPFEEETQTALDFMPKEDLDHLVDFNIRRKVGYDAIRGCGYEVSQVNFTVNYGDENGNVTAEMVAVDWDDEFTAVVDLTDLHTDQNTAGRVPEQEVRDRILSALWQMLDL